MQKSHLEAKKLEATKEESDKSGNGTPDDDDASPFDNLRPRGGSIFIPQDAESPGMFPGWNFVSSPTKGGPSYFPPKGESPLQYERRESIFVSNEEPSVFQKLDFASDENAPQTGRRGSTFAPDEADENDTPLATPAVEAPRRKPVVSCPSEEIMKILARKD